ncbi:MAG TPA: PEP-CTERM sorting domain-containing protein [Puia sp.]|nr:PEP-CTERM sorting domain-containing protein [Puia sp.]
MKKRELAALSTIILLGTGIAIWMAARRRKARQQRVLIADAGYETAYDILFPQKAGRPNAG